MSSARFLSQENRNCSLSFSGKKGSLISAKTAAVVGLGQIGMGYDLNSDPAQTVGTHCRAISLNDSMRLIAGVDQDNTRRQEFIASYCNTVVDSVGELYRQLDPDFVAVATPTSTHLRVFEEIASRARPNLVLMEKPLAASYAEAQEILRIAESSQIPVLVNFLRRADESFHLIRALYANSVLEPPHRGVCWYTGGALNSASHFIDLLQGWFGQLEVLNITRTFPINSFDFAGDFSLGNGQVEIDFLHLNPQNARHYSLHIYSQNGRLDYDLGGRRITMSNSGTDEHYSEQVALVARSTRVKSDFSKLMSKVYLDVETQLLANGPRSILTSLNEASSVNRILSEIGGTVSWA